MRDSLYKILEDVATGGVSCSVPTKNGDEVIISRQEYHDIVLEKELLKEFKSPIQFLFFKYRVFIAPTSNVTVKLLCQIVRQPIKA